MKTRRGSVKLPQIRGRTSPLGLRALGSPTACGRRDARAGRTVRSHRRLRGGPLDPLHLSDRTASYEGFDGPHEPEWGWAVVSVHPDTEKLIEHLACPHESLLMMDPIGREMPPPVPPSEEG